MKHSFDDKVEDIKRNLEINEKALEYEREMTNGKINEINKLFTDKIQTQSDAITAQVKEFEKKLTEGQFVVKKQIGAGGVSQIDENAEANLRAMNEKLFKKMDKMKKKMQEIQDMSNYKISQLEQEV